MKHLLVLLLLLCSAVANAQDVIVKKDGSTILSKVLEIGQEEIKYKKYDNLDGPTYTIQKSELQAINYQNGAKDMFSAPVREENRYLPNNQNDGTQQYNDRALLALDAQSNQPKYKKLKNMAWIGGGIATAIGIIGLAAAQSDPCEGDSNSYDTKLAVGIVFTVIGVSWTTGFLLAANHAKKEYNSLQVSSIYQQKITLSNGTSLSLGTNLLSDRTLGSKTIGLGLRYIF